MTAIYLEDQDLFLSDTEIFYQGHTYSFAKIKGAFVKKQLFRPAKLMIEFKSGRKIEFKINQDNISAKNWANTINQFLR